MVINAPANITNQKSYMTDVGNPCAASTTTLRTYEIIFKTATTTTTNGDDDDADKGGERTK